MKDVAYHRLAASELIASAKFYERQGATLGAAFLAAVEATLAYIQRHPELGGRATTQLAAAKLRGFRSGSFIAKKLADFGLWPSRT